MAATVVGETLLPPIVLAEENQVFFRGEAALAASNRAREGFTDNLVCEWLYCRGSGVVHRH